ncbi:MAG: hypothetical protein WAU68_07230 [Vitreimonas sp.]
MICEHARHWYPGVGGEPPVFLLFEESEFPSGHELKNTPSDSGDDCHRDEVKLSDKQLKKFRKLPVERFSTCDNGAHRAVSAEDIEKWRATSEAV